MQRFAIKHLSEFLSRRRGEIRLTDRILTDPRFTRLADAQRWHLIGLMLMAARAGNHLPDSVDAFPNVAAEGIDLTHLRDLGLIEPLPDDRPTAEDKKASRYISEELRVQVLVRDGARCKRCSRTEGLEIDHVTPLSKGGKTELENLQTLCAKCNRRKSDKHRGNF